MSKSGSQIAVSKEKAKTGQAGERLKQAQEDLKTWEDLRRTVQNLIPINSEINGLSDIQIPQLEKEIASLAIKVDDAADELTKVRRKVLW